MRNKYKDTIFDPSVKFPIPIKKSYSKDYFIKLPIKEVWFISLSNLLFLLVYYMILMVFWFFLYNKHFIAVNILTLINVFFSIVILLRDKTSWKNTLDIIKIIFKFTKSKNIGLLRPKKGDILSRNQTDSF